LALEGFFEGLELVVGEGRSRFSLLLAQARAAEAVFVVSIVVFVACE
jgi:hypothetical protein